MVLLVTLPVEILLQFVEQAKQHRSLKALRGVNRQFCSLVTPFLFNRIVIRLSQASYSSVLKALSSPDSTRVFHSTRQLVIHRSDELNDPSSRSSTIFIPSKADESLQCEFVARLSAAMCSLRSNLKSVKLLSGLSDYRALSISCLWDCLSEIDVSLKEIHISGKVDETLPTYLDSYSGLETLVMRGVWGPSDGNEDRRLAESVSRSLLRHRDSLQRLTVIAERHGPWSFGRHLVNDFDQLKSLRYLTLSVNSEDVAMCDAEADSDIITAWLYVAHRLPNLRSLELCMPESKSLSRWSRGIGASMESDRRIPYSITLIVRRVLAFDLPRDFENEASPNVEVYGQVYRMSLEGKYRSSLTDEEAKARRWVRHGD
ncbi:hypothetical protein V5O48_014814 [Marasmius crinis-equi]|uniref:F-box domain-containing protein n=1 Tax=Marasmius crinis-equi TaxID=585013 RepID=A0ABR3EWA3_9AGAR